MLHEGRLVVHAECAHDGDHYDAASELRLAQFETVDLHAEAQVLPPVFGEIAADLAGAWQGNPRWSPSLVSSRGCITAR